MIETINLILHNSDSLYTFLNPLFLKINYAYNHLTPDRYDYQLLRTRTSFQTKDRTRR